MTTPFRLSTICKKKMVHKGHYQIGISYNKRDPITLKENPQTYEPEQAFGKEKVTKVCRRWRSN
jgi:hypothetical protein